MIRIAVVFGALALLMAGGSSIAGAQAHPDPAVLLSAQREAMSRLDFMDGAWRGAAWTRLPSGEKHELTQTERVGPFLDGAVKVIEGRGYEVDGSVSFRALAVISYDPNSGTYSMRSYAQGHSGDFAFMPTADGFQWEIPAGPMKIRYTAVVENGTWHEVGDRVLADGQEIRFFEMNLTRIGDSEWPAAGAIEAE